MKQIINIGLIGYGTVGSGVYNIIKKNPLPPIHEHSDWGRHPAGNAIKKRRGP